MTLHNLMETSASDNNLHGPIAEIHMQELQYGTLIGRSQSMQKVFQTIEKVAQTDSTVLINGESGTGKELIARAIHLNSSRHHKPMITINCGAIPHELLESELFGHEKGAFTGAHRTRTGRFEVAHQGTMFLDEIGDMSPSLQVKLLRVLQEQSFERVGSVQVINVDVRIIAATNKDLEQSIEEKSFREDLYYRLNVIPIRVPPLRERKEDIALLTDFFLGILAQKWNQEKKTIDNEAMDHLMAYDWPGNIRELENLMERVSVLSEGITIRLEDLPKKIQGNVSQQVTSEIASLEVGFDFYEALDQFQRKIILQSLNQSGWVKAKAAELLGLNRTTLVEKIKKLKIESESDILFT